jgi:hypothetical protein
MNVAPHPSIFYKDDDEDRLGTVAPEEERRDTGTDVPQRSIVERIARNAINRFSLSQFDLSSDDEVKNKSASSASSAPSVSRNTAHIESLSRLHSLSDLRPKRTASFSALQEWEGYVVGLSDTHVLANLIDLSKPGSRADNAAQIPLEEFSDHDLRRVRLGSVFRWAIGYQRSPSGTKMRVSQIVFRELPQWTAKELEHSEKEATELAASLNKSDAQDPNDRTNARSD